VAELEERAGGQELCADLDALCAAIEECAEEIGGRPARSGCGVDIENGLETGKGP
jgi:hypothetical protein